MNNVHYYQLIILPILIKKRMGIKANANYTNNAVEREIINRIKDGFKMQIQINNFYTDKIKGELIFTKNAKKGFFKNTTSFLNSGTQTGLMLLGRRLGRSKL
jgi:hypothetical protein